MDASKNLYSSSSQGELYEPRCFAPASNVFMLTIMSICLAGCGGTKSTYDISNHFVVKEIGATFRWKAHHELYVKEPDGQLTFIGATPDPQWAEKSPFSITRIPSKYFAVSEDGESIVYAHNFGPPEKQTYGVYYRRYNEPARLLLKGYIGATDRGKPLPDYVVAIGKQGVTTEGKIVELALLESSALHEAAFTGDVERIEVLVREGHDLHALNYWEHEPLELAIVQRHEAAAVRLIEHGAHASPRSALILYLAANYKLTEAVQALLSQGTSVNAVGPEGYTPVHAALLLPGAYVHHDMIIDQLGVSEYGAILPKAVEVLQLILAHGGDPNALSEHEGSPLDLLARTQYYWDQQPQTELQEELRRILIEAGARP